MKHGYFSLLFLLIFFLLVSGCTPIQTTETMPLVSPLPDETPAILPEPTLTLTAIPTTTPEPTRTSPATPTVEYSATPFPFLISYTYYSDGGDDLWLCLRGNARPTFLLYPDGKLVFLEDGQYWQSQLVEDEIQSLYDQLSDTGLFQRSEKTYIEGNSELIVNGKRYYASWDLSETDPLERALDIIFQYQHANPQRYVPENLVLGIYQYRDIESLDELLADPNTSIANWATSPLATYGETWERISGEDVAMVMAQFSDFPGYKVYKQDDIYYVACICATSPYP